MVGVKDGVEHPALVAGNVRNLTVTNEMIVTGFSPQHGGKARTVSVSEFKPRVITERMQTIGCGRAFQQFDDRAARWRIDTAVRGHIHDSLITPRSDGLEGTRTQLIEGAVSAHRLLGAAHSTSMQNDAKTELAPLRRRQKPAQFSFDLHRVFFRRKAEATGEAANVGINGQPRKVERHTAHHIRRFATNTGQRGEILHRPGHLAIKGVNKPGRHCFETVGLGVKKPGRTNQFLKLSLISGREIDRLRIPDEQCRSDLIDLLVRALGRKNGGHQQLKRVGVIELTLGVGIQLGEERTKCRGAAFRGTWSSHKRGKRRRVRLSHDPNMPMTCSMNRLRTMFAIAGVVIVGVQLGVPAPVSGAPTDKTAITMGSVQIVHAIDSMRTLNVSLQGKVRARGVPRLAVTAPLAVSAGDGALSVVVNEAAASSPTRIDLMVKAGARRTVFLVGTPTNVRSVVVDSLPSDGSADSSSAKRGRDLQIVDLRPAAERSPVTVGGKTHALSPDGVSQRFMSTGALRVELNGQASPDVSPNLTGPLLLVVTRAPDGDHVMALRHNTSDVNGLRTQVVAKVRVPGPPLASLIVSLLVILAATAMALSSMMSLRVRMREDRVRNRMAQTMGLS
jgi:hypothetical protein